mmetsp:Transcript_31388/g.42845  ORF Transcript_31388/g.42845 Transcript_31388/m.42845 type:complete len:158 (-) Transcript_31388:454-927(-)
MLIMTTGCVSMTTLESDGESGQRAAGGGPVRSVAASLWAWTPLAVAVPLRRLDPSTLPHLLKGSTVTAKQSNLNCRLVSLFVAATAECHPVRLPAQQDTLARSSLFLRRPHLTPSDVLELGQKSGECKEMFRQVENSRRNRRKMFKKHFLSSLFNQP